VCSCVEKAALHLNIVTVEMEQVKEEGKERAKGCLVPSSQARNAVCVLFCLLIVVIIHSLYEYRSP
jgi:hypothetical protein